MKRSTLCSSSIFPLTVDPGPITTRGLRDLLLPNPQLLGFSTMISPLTTLPSTTSMSPLTVDTSPPISAPVSAILPFTLLTLFATVDPFSTFMRPFTVSTSPATVTDSANLIEPLTVDRLSACTPSARLTPPLTVEASCTLAPESMRIEPLTVSASPVTLAFSPMVILPLTDVAPLDSPPASIFMLLLIDAPRAGTAISITSNPIVKTVFVINFAIFLPLNSFLIS